tara:strand:+ start:145 stop:294 length:150 start_codon:yes stop_codon:yes gene_type:complete
VVAVKKDCRSRLIDQVSWRACHRQIFNSFHADQYGAWLAPPGYRFKQEP